MKARPTGKDQGSRSSTD